MSRPKSVHPTELELEILKILWDQSPLAVRDVRESLEAAGRTLAHTSVITTLNVMVGKKYLKRTMQGNSCLFAANVARTDVSGQMLDDIVRRVFDGSAKAVMLSLFDSSELDADELKELRKSLNQKLKEQSK